MAPLLSLTISILVILIAAAFGRRVLSLLGVKTDTPVERCVFGIGIGLGGLSYLVLAVGLIGWLRTPVLIALVGLMAVVSIREIVSIFGEMVSGVRNYAGLRPGAWGSLIALSLLSLGVFALIRALSPAAADDWDGLAYHLAVPKMYLARGAVYYIQFISHSNFPFLVEMLYTIGLAFGSTVPAKLFHFWMYAATALAVYSICRRHFTPSMGAVGALIFASIPVAFWEAGVAYADLATALYITLAVYALLNWEQSLQPSWLVVCGIAGGFALGTKVLASVPIIVMCAAVLMILGRSDGWAKAAKVSLLLGVLAAIVGAPWYVKSFIYTGNPVYPFLYDIFGGRNWSQEAAEAYRTSQLAFGLGRGIPELLMLPWNLTMNGYPFYDCPSMVGLIGIAFIGLIPIQILAGRWSRAMLIIAAVSAVYIVAWFFLMQQSRYLIGVFPLMSIAAAGAVSAAESKWNVGRHIVRGFVLFSAAITIFIGFLLASGAVSTVAGNETPEEYAARTFAPYTAISFINDSLPEDARIVLFDEVRGFHLDREYIWGNPGHHELIPWSTFEDGDDMVEHFLQSGYTHALINWEHYAGDDPLHSKLIPDSIGKGLMKEIHGSQRVSVYEFTER